MKRNGRREVEGRIGFFCNVIPTHYPFHKILVSFGDRPSNRNALPYRRVRFFCCCSVNNFQMRALRLLNIYPRLC